MQLAHLLQMYSLDNESDDGVIVDFIFNQSVRKTDKGVVRDTTNLLIDTGSTLSCLNNPKMLIRVRKSERPIRGYSNGGETTTEYEGDMPDFSTTYYNPKSLMDILAFSNVRKRFRITVDTAKENAIIVHVGKRQRNEVCGS